MSWCGQKGLIVPSKRGFSSMDKQKQREIASKGGKAAHQKGTAHEFTSEEARVAGRKGGAASRARRTEPLDSESSSDDRSAEMMEREPPASDEPQPTE
jgi:general stress protein YciG